MLAILVRLALVSAARLHAAANALPDVAPGMADAFVDAALDEATPHAPAALLVALGWGESRFDPRARPACGAMQVYPTDLGAPPSACEVWATDLRAGVRAGVLEIETMLADTRVRGDLRLMLLYRACGNAAFTSSAACGPAKRAWVTATLARYADLTRRVATDN